MRTLWSDFKITGSPHQMHKLKDKSIFSKIKNNGIRWLIWRVKREFYTPQINWIRKIIDSALLIKQRVGKEKQTNVTPYLFGIYDLEIAPITFNIIEYLAYIDYLSKERKGFVIVFIPKLDRAYKYESDYEKIVDESNQNWRVDNILYAVARLHPRCKGIYLLPDRTEIKQFLRGKEVFPSLYDGLNLRYYDTREYFKTMTKPGLWTPISPSKQGMRYIDQYVESKRIKQKIVTITIRNYEYDPARNSNAKEWAKFTDYLLEKSYYPLIIPDAENVFSDDFPKHRDYLFREGCWNFGIRLAMYKKAYLNIGVANGPICVLLHSTDARVLIMNSSPKDSIVSSPELNANNVRPYEQWDFLTPSQRLSFVPDTFENIVLEFNRYVTDNGWAHVLQNERNDKGRCMAGALAKIIFQVWLQAWRQKTNADYCICKVQEPWKPATYHHFTWELKWSESRYRGATLGKSRSAESTSLAAKATRFWLSRINRTSQCKPLTGGAGLATPETWRPSAQSLIIQKTRPHQNRIVQLWGHLEERSIFEQDRNGCAVPQGGLASFLPSILVGAPKNRCFLALHADFRCQNASISAVFR